VHNTIFTFQRSPERGVFYRFLGLFRLTFDDCNSVVHNSNALFEAGAIDFFQQRKNTVRYKVPTDGGLT